MGFSREVEEYLEEVYRFEEESEGLMSTGLLAERLGLTPGTVTKTIKRMAGKGLVVYEPYKGVRLTRRGRRVARRVIRGHRVFERFLHDVLGLDEVKAHEEACRLEHDAGEETVEKLHTYLGYPSDSISDKEIPGSKELVPLSDLEPGDRGRFKCVQHGGACVISKLLGLGVAPDEDFVFVRRMGRGPVILRVGDSEVAVGRGIAKRIRVVLE